jgi:hypothetical protein
MLDRVNSSLGSSDCKLDHSRSLVRIKLVIELLIWQKCANLHWEDTGLLSFDEGKIRVVQLDVVFLEEVVVDTSFLLTPGSESVVLGGDTFLGVFWLVRENEPLDGVWLFVCTFELAIEETACSVEILRTVFLASVLNSEFQLLHLLQGLEIHRLLEPTILFPNWTQKVAEDGGVQTAVACIAQIASSLHNVLAGPERAICHINIDSEATNQIAFGNMLRKR